MTGLKRQLGDLGMPFAFPDFPVSGFRLLSRPARRQRKYHPVTQANPSVDDTPSRAGAAEYDEMVRGDGVIRPAWRPLIGAVHAMPEGALAERTERACREFQDVAIAYDLGLERQAVAPVRPVDLLPMLLPAAEWAALEAGLAQRARLLERILADIYGPQDLLADRRIPPALVHANPRFLRPCAGGGAAGRVLAYAADLVRAPDGRWLVQADRLQAPAGIGFALQTRAILARTVPELFRAHSVQRIEPFFERWKTELAATPTEDGRPAQVAVLTPGPFNASFFEHLYLARQLGAAVVEGADLTVRGDRLYIKTLGALRRVDLVLRFLDDEFCDPLELRGDSVLGAAGLLQAVRAGTVTIANGLGASVVETPALRPFLPGLAEALLGEPLTLPSVDTEWLGRAEALERFLRHPGAAALRPAFATRRDEQIFAQEIERFGPASKLDEVRREPHRFVAERRPSPSVIPTWSPGGLVPQPLSLRVFLVRSGDGYMAMPGGFVQVPAERGDAATPLNPPMTAKDCWVLAGAQRAPVAAAVPPKPIAIRRPGDDLRSRNADDLFWLGRYTERLDNAARMMRAAAQRLAVDWFGIAQREEIDHLIRVLVDERLVDPASAEAVSGLGGLHRLIIDACCGRSALHDIFRSVHRIAQSLRDRLSNDVWRVVLRLLRDASERLTHPAADVDRLIATLDDLIGLVAAFGGMASENMTRGNGWRFLDVGRRLERAIYTLSVLRELTSGETESDSALGLALELCDSSITYRARYLGALQTGPVVDLVMADETNPRGVAFQLNGVAQHLIEIAASFRRAPAPECDTAEAILSSIRGVRLDRLDDGRGERRHLGRLLLAAQQELVELSDTISRSYFSHTLLPHSVGYEWSRR